MKKRALRPLFFALRTRAKIARPGCEALRETT